MLKFIFKDTSANTELVLPVTPESFEISNGINIETVNIHTLGDVAVAGYGTLPSFKIECIFPAHDYPFNQPGTDTNPYNYVVKFVSWSDNRVVLRYVISDTSVNIPVLVKDISYGEKDGTRDVYASLELKTYREIMTLQAAKAIATDNYTRTVESPSSVMQSYVIVKGDTLSGICRRFYGDAALYQALAEYNNIKNANLIYAGNTIKIPEKSMLRG